MQRLEPILKSWVIWLTLAASVAGFVALVVTDGDAHAQPQNDHPTRTGGRGPARGDAWRGQIAYAVPTGGADPTVVEVATPQRHDAAAVYRAPGGEVIRGLAWSPDGARLAVVVGAHGGDGHVLVMDVSGAHVTAVTHGAMSSASVAWSPNGRLLAYDLAKTLHPNQGAPLVVSRPDGSGRRLVTPPHEFAVAPAWSPSGRSIAYISPFSPAGSASADGEVDLIPAAGGARVKVSGVYDGHEPTWAPDGREIVFAGSWAGGQGLLRVSPLRPNHVFLAFDCSDRLRCSTVSSPSWSRDGSDLAFLAAVEQPSRSEFSMIESGSTTESVPLRRLPLYTCCLAWWTPPPGQAGTEVAYIPQRSAPSSWSSADASASVDTGPSPRISTRTDTVRATLSSTARLRPPSSSSSVTASSPSPDRATTV